MLAALAACSDDFSNSDGGAALGAAYAGARGCANCHGDGLTGRAAALDGGLAGSTPYAPNLTPDRATGLGGWADIEIVRTLRAGVDDQGAPLCPPMPVFEDMTDLEAYSIAAYLRSLPPVSHSVPASLCPPLKPAPGPDLAMTPSDDLAVTPPDLSPLDDGGASD
ncbi:MAG TPA: c-type cytochrome [Polyangia bacterium]|nr:c-type cytochrome [Polyangia bacterium]